MPSVKVSVVQDNKRTSQSAKCTNRHHYTDVCIQSDQKKTNQNKEGRVGEGGGGLYWSLPVEFLCNNHIQNQLA